MPYTMEVVLDEKTRMYRVECRERDTGDLVFLGPGCKDRDSARATASARLQAIQHDLMEHGGN